MIIKIVPTQLLMSSKQKQSKEKDYMEIMTDFAILLQLSLVNN